jgi:SAP domain
VLHDLQGLGSLTKIWLPSSDAWDIDNPSVTGFFIEQAILSSIASHGLKIHKEISKNMHTVMFSGSFPRFNMTERNPVLYCPINFNYRGIDGIIVRFVEKKCFMFPLQITIAKSHSDSEEVFFREWSMWTDRLNDIEVVPEFVWITKEDSENDTVNAQYRTTKSGTRLVRPSYSRQKVPLKTVSLDIWEHYQRALGKLQENLKRWASDEYLRDDQAPLDASETEKVGGEEGGGKEGGDRTTGGEEQREPEKPEGAEEQARSGGPSATARPSVQEARESEGQGRREDYMKKRVPELRKLLKDRSKPSTGTKSELVDRLLEDC